MSPSWTAERNPEPGPFSEWLFALDFRTDLPWRE